MAPPERQKRPLSSQKVPTLKDDEEPGLPEVEDLQRIFPEAHREVLMSAVVQHQGPLPSPAIFKGYAEVVPDAPERILRQFEANSAHSRDFQMAALKAQMADNRRTHWMAFGLVALCMVMATIFGILGQPWLAAVFIGAPLLGAATQFLKRQKTDSDDPDIERKTKQ